jgi:Peptidase A4 family
VAPPSGVPQQRTSYNWSGYVVIGGPFTEANGTFTVSGLGPGTPQPEVMSEWVGIDGQAGTGGYLDLIQAGVMQSMNPRHGVTANPNGPYDPDKFYVCPWTFFIEKRPGIAGTGAATDCECRRLGFRGDPATERIRVGDLYDGHHDRADLVERGPVLRRPRGIQLNGLSRTRAKLVSRAGLRETTSPGNAPCPPIHLPSRSTGWV